MRDLRPDYKKWRMVFFRFSYIITVIAAILEIIMYFLADAPESRDLSPTIYVLHYIIGPFSINILIITITYIFRKTNPANDTLINASAILSNALICCVIANIHFKIFSVTFSHCIPIFMSVIFGNFILTSITAVIGLCSSISIILLKYNYADTYPEYPLLWEDIVVLIIVLISVYLIAIRLIGMMRGQMFKLMNVAKESAIAQKREAAANNAKSEFLAHMSHEIRTPLNAIIGMNEMIIRETAEHNVRDYARSVNSAGNTLLSIINDILDFSKIESGKLELIPTDYHLASLIRDSYGMLSDKIRAKKLAGIIECSPDLPSKLHGDELRIRQILVNLLSNAVKYTEKGTITFKITGETDDGYVTIHFSISDTGIGIKEEDIPKLFTDFTRFDQEHTRTIQGTGLGLAITKQLITIMNGNINVTSKYGEGTTFTVTLRQRIVDEKPIGPYEDIHSLEPVATENARKQFEAPDAHILVVDDVIINLKVVNNLLKHTKIHIDTASSGAQCLELVQLNKYDIIFMDHMMPEMDGIETLEAMKQLTTSLNNDTPVVMLTANAISGVEDKYIGHGFTDYLSKPILGYKLEDIIIRNLPDDKIHYEDM